MICDALYITVTQKDAYIWEALLPNGLDVYIFITTTKDESVTCKVTTYYSEDSDVAQPPVADCLRFYVSFR